MFQMKASLLTTRATQPSSQTSESRQKDAYLQVNSLRRSLTWASSSTLNGLLCFQVMGSQWEKMIRLTIIGCTIMAWPFSKVRNYDKHSSTLNDCNFFWNEIQNCYIFFLLSSFLVTQSLSLFFSFFSVHYFHISQKRTDWWWSAEFEVRICLCYWWSQWSYTCYRGLLFWRAVQEGEHATALFSLWRHFFLLVFSTDSLLTWSWCLLYVWSPLSQCFRLRLI